ncbi:MAG: response regulator [Magnetococcales bacterium]|nr:response regulator [Magnetococcales bacterium]
MLNPGIVLFTEKIATATELVDGLMPLGVDIFTVDDQQLIGNYQQSHSIVLLVLDGFKDHMDALDRIKSLLSPFGSPTPPLMVVTPAGLYSSQIEQIYLAGASDFVETPVLPIVLQKRAALLLEHFKMKQMVNQQIAELEQKQLDLVSLQEKAQVLTRAKTLFLDNMSHEIRSPMNAVIGLSDLLLSTNLDENQREYMQLVLDSAESLMALLNDILDFSKLEAGKLSLESVSFSLSEAIALNDDALEREIIRKGLTLKRHIDDDIPKNLIGDPERLGKIILNLVSNGVKFTKQGEIAIHVSNFHHPTDQAIVLHFRVSDTGIGIPGEKLGTIFDRFSQIDSGFTRKYAGTGLGLAICEQLVELMGGHIWVESELGLGSTFHFTAQFLSTKNAHLEELLESSRMEQDRPRKLLLVEDDSINQEVIAETLTRNGHQVVVASDGLECLEKLRNQSFEMILMDVKMPVMNGNDATRMIRQGGAFDSTIPIVGLSANAMKDNIQESLASGMDDFITKPCRGHILIKIIGKAEYFRNKNERNKAKRPCSDEAGLESERSIVSVFLALEQALKNGETRVALDSLTQMRAWAKMKDQEEFDQSILQIQAILRGQDQERALTHLPRLREKLEETISLS